MSIEWTQEKVAEVINVTDYVANGSFAALRENVTYRNEPDFAIMVRLVDHNSSWAGDFVYVDEASYRFLRKSSIEPGDVIIANVGANAGTVFRAPSLGQPMTLGPNAILCRPRRESIVSRDYLYYYFVSPYGQAQIASILSGSAQPKFNKTDFRSLELPLPSLDEQRRIAAILGSLDDKIEHNRRTARKLEELARAIFKAWFVDFEPVKAKAEGATSFPSMPQEVFDALPTTFVETEIGPVPEGWGVKAVGDLSGLSRDQIKPAEYPDEVFDHFSLPAFDAGRRPVHDLGGSIKSNKFIVKDGSVLLSKLNPRIPRVWLPSQARDRRQIASTEFLVFQPRKPAYRSYLYLLFSQDAFQHEMTQQATGTSTSHQRIKPKDLLRMKAVTGNLQVQNAFPALVNPILELVETGQKESDRLAVTRDYLLPRLISNKL